MNIFYIFVDFHYFRIIQTADRKEGFNENDENSNAQALTDDRHNFKQNFQQKKKYFKKVQWCPI